MPVVQLDEGARSWSGRAAHVHALQLYDSDAFLTRVVSRFLSPALSAGGAVLVVATEAHRRDLAAALAEAGHDVGAAERSGQLGMADARSTLDLLMVRGMPDRTRFLEHVGRLVEGMQATGPQVPLHVFGEMVDLLARDGNHEAALRLEQLWNALARQHRFALLCAYGLDAFPHPTDDVHLERICDEHARVVPAETYRPDDPGEARAREIVRLQQRARALEGEVAERVRAERDLSAALRARDSLLAQISHELRNPVGVLFSSLDLLRRRFPGEPEIDVMARQATHLRGAIDDIVKDMPNGWGGDLALGEASGSVEGRRRAARRRVLVVDDNRDAASALGELLALHGHVVKVAHSADEALAIAPRFAPELSLLDLGLPVMDGFQLCEQLRKLDSAARVIAVSGYGDHASRARSALAGFEAHLVKPVPIQELLALLAA